MSRIRGLELIFNLVKGQLKSKEDCLVAALHCLLINENLQCVGTGEEFSDQDASTKSELLPKQWNDNQEVYTLRYISRDSKKRYLIKIVKAGHIMHVNVVLNEETTAAMSVNIGKHVAEDYSEFTDDTYKELESLTDTFRRDIMEKIIGSPNKASAHKSSDGNRNPTSPTARPNVPNPLARPSRPPLSAPPPFGAGGRPTFPQIGGDDLDPFGRGGGGSMLLDPSGFGIPSRPRLPPGAVPPGARFDPFGPPVPGPNRFNPNPDHFRKPDDFDEFM